jgi:hypothetical protein
VECETCDALLADYKRAVIAFKEAMQASAGGTGPDSQMARNEAVRLSRACKDASDALMGHWRTEHQGLAAKSGSS